MKSAHVAALLIVLGSALMLPSHGAAQLGLGSLIVTIASPTSGATVGGTITYSANVSIIGTLTVRSVEFKVDGVRVGSEDFSAPYSIQWDTKTAANGTHRLTACARDLLGVIYESEVVTVTVFNDKTPPTIAITSPAANATVIGTTTIAASASDNVGVTGVQFRLDGVSFGAEDTTAPYSIAWDTLTASNGPHTLTAVARDAAGNVSTSTAVTVTVANDSTPPSVAIAAPAAGAALRGTATVSASASDNVAVAGVQFRLDGANLGAEDTAAPYSVPWTTTTTANGSHTLLAVARDTAGNVTTSASVVVTVDNAAPAVAIVTPASGATVAGTATVSANASDNSAVAGVQFRLDGVNLGAEDTSSPYSVPWNTATATNGSHSLTATARDAAGNVTTSTSVTVTVFNDSTPPAVAISAPASGATVSGTVTVSANASDNEAVAGVQFKLDGANLGAEDTSAPYSVPWNTTTATSGSHSLTATARDAAGNVRTSTAVTVTVVNDSTAPAVAITAPAAGATVTGTVSITASATDEGGIAGVQFKLDGANLGAEDTSVPYSVPWDTTAATTGSHVITAVARDTAGNSATSASVTVTVDNAGPTVAITSPSPGATVSATVTVSANASDSGGIAGVQFKLDGANLGAEDTTAPYAVSWDTTTAVNGSHTLTVVARDTAGSTTTSSAVTVTVANASETVTRVEDTSASIAYAGSWALGNTAKAWSGGTAALATSGATATGDATRATLTFSGTGVRWIGFTGPQTGIARVYLDGALVATVDTYAAAETVEAVLYTASGLASTTHTLAIESTGTKNAASADIFVVVDAFDVTSSGGGGDTTPPTVAITTPPAGSTASGTITVTANASDNSGIAGVQFFLDGAKLQAEDATAPYSINWDTTAAADGSHTLTAVARDAVGNTATSAAVGVTVGNGTAPPPPAVMTRFEDTDPSITYTDGTPAAGQPDKWWYGSRSRAWSGTTAAFNRSAGARATFRFTGTSVSWIGFRAYWAGIARVYVDGAFAGEIDLFEPPNPSDRNNGEKAQAVVFSAAGLPAGEHTLTVESTGRKHGAVGCDPAADPANCASDFAVVVDAFDAGPSIPPPVAGTRFEETASSVQFTPSWRQDASKPWSGGTARASGAAGEAVTFRFTGTSVRWVGLCSPTTGIAHVYIDGAFHAEVDTRSPRELQAIVFTVSNLAWGSHELRIVVPSAGGDVVVDAFDVQARVEDMHPSIVYTGASWRKENPDKAWSGTSGNAGSGTAALSAGAGDQAEFTFTGTSVRWIGYRGPLAGIADVFLDGGETAVARVDLYSATESVDVPVFTASALPDGTHRLRIVATGQKNPAASAAFVVIDAFDVTFSSSLPLMTRLQETDSAIAYLGATDWTRGSRFRFDSGEFSMGSYRVDQNGQALATAGTRARLSFTGTAVRWIGRRGFATGVANVYLDGVRVATIDTRAPLQEEMQAAIYSVSGLPNAAHTLDIELIGRNNESPGAPVEHPIWIDAFDIGR